MEETNSDEFFSILGLLYSNSISYDDWVNVQRQMLLTHPPKSIFSINPETIKVVSTRLQNDRLGPDIADMDDNYYWRFFTDLCKKGYIVSIKVICTYRRDRSQNRWTQWVNFANFNEFLAEKRYISSSHNRSLKFGKWTISFADPQL